MAKNNEESDLFQKYGVPIYGAAWIPTKNLLSSSDEDEDHKEKEEDNKPSNSSSWIVFCCGGGEGSSGIPNCLSLIQFDPASNSLSPKSEDSPLIRAYGAIRFDARSSISSEWKGFGSFYFTIPQVEFVELKGSSMLAMTIAWDNKLLWTWGKAVETLQATLCKISSATVQLQKETPSTFILGVNHAPNKTSWDVAVSKALRMINSSNSDLVKVVLARSSRVITATDLYPIEWLACLQGEGENAYQFCIQPPGAPAFIGNTGAYGTKMRQIQFMALICIAILFIVYRTTTYQHQQTEMEARLRPFDSVEKITSGTN